MSKANSWRHWSKGGYRPGYSEANSPTYKQGHADGLADTVRLRDGQEPEGPQPPFPDHPHMYNRGYYETFDPTAALEKLTGDAG